MSYQLSSGAEKDTTHGVF